MVLRLRYTVHCIQTVDISSFICTTTAVFNEDHVDVSPLTCTLTNSQVFGVRFKYLYRSKSEGSSGSLGS